MYDRHSEWVSQYSRSMRWCLTVFELGARSSFATNWRIERALTVSVDRSSFRDATNILKPACFGRSDVDGEQAEVPLDY
jgi:hypothetical protein